MAKESNQKGMNSILDEAIPTPGLIVEIRVGWNVGNGEKRWLGSTMAVDPSVSFGQADEAMDRLPAALAGVMARMREG